MKNIIRASAACILLLSINSLFALNIAISNATYNSGELSLITKITTGADPTQVLITQDNHNIYVANYISGNINEYAYNDKQQVLSSIGVVNIGSTLVGLAMTNDDKYVYGSDVLHNQLLVFYRNSNGLLKLLPDFTTATHTSPQLISISPDSKFLYVANSLSNDISEYAILYDGSLKELDQSPIAAGNMPQKITLSHDGRSAYVINAADNTINVFSRNIVNGELTLLEVGAKLPTGKLPVDMVISNDDRFLYVTNLNSSTVYEYQRYGNVLKLYAKLKTLSSPIEISISNDDKYLYIANSGDNVTSQYTINQLDGSIEPDAKPTVACGSLPTAMAASQKNKLILVTAQQTDELYLYKIN